ncbi:protein MAIN-LIKE 2-like [Papaver somniferum]|uniref:protein MAIN-LIKE 2-like n=1 Tax=Papaver somniferum TaxID=3469 RepID=UPI000E6F59ED|nr:protein MAIN-LIKE 2-like [Papaver somniferum]
MTTLWPLEKLCEEVKAIVKNSGLWPAMESSIVEYDKVTVSALCERFYGETNTTLFPFSEMVVTPDDALQILCLEVEGKAISDSYNDGISWENIFKFKKILFSLDEKLSESLFVKKDGYISRKLCLKMLMDTYSGTQKTYDDEGSVPMISGSLVDSKYLQLLHPFHEMHKYSWGTAVVAFLNAELTKGLRALAKQVNGNLCLIQVWVYEHFPSLLKGNPHIKVNTKLASHLPRGQRYSFIGAQDKDMSHHLINMRVSLDKMTADEVIFNMYRDDRNEGFSMYDPHRVMRQLGYIQEKPHASDDMFFKVDRAGCNTSQKSIDVCYAPQPEISHWNGRYNRKTDTSLLDEVTEGREAHENYMSWYLGFARPTVIREETIEQPACKRKMPPKYPTTSLKNFVSILLF